MHCDRDIKICRGGDKLEISKIFPLVTTSLSELKAVAQREDRVIEIRKAKQSELQQEEESFSALQDFSIHMVLPGYLQG